MDMHTIHLFLTQHKAAQNNLRMMKNATTIMKECERNGLPEWADKWQESVTCWRRLYRDALKQRRGYKVKLDNQRWSAQ